MPQQYPDTWHDLEAAAERAWLDQWVRDLYYGVIVEPYGETAVDPAVRAPVFITA
ncbi:hypothetical protein [Streptomyces lavendofoliae]|uniref:Uncharacterized protein n=1 Tax=Streptomyces lavendofoliae TaxID=67314 RepID=A0A918I4Q1_9ACTN|nr:hypothetical protein [Streptomyces lavendofoliae]GGU62015.1 hypothetical protein GCM10010274_58480 [Streptomyces lavendofoliae]